MCRQTTCRDCGKPTWTGCGAHIEQALANVPVEKRCTCHSPKSQGTAPASAPAKKRFGFF